MCEVGGGKGGIGLLNCLNFYVYNWILMKYILSILRGKNIKSCYIWCIYL